MILITTDTVDYRHEEAMERYHERYNNDIYRAAIGFVPYTDQGKVSHTNMLLDSAMALCGDPYFKYTPTMWTQAEQTFLELFISKD